MLFLASEMAFVKQQIFFFELLAALPSFIHPSYPEGVVSHQQEPKEPAIAAPSSKTKNTSIFKTCILIKPFSV
ncbi:MAG: hypothetical protein ACD_79C01129G0003 [uncultured bacterium]|nr:MAG: hypothetical protein ACD_79C01129G0003 [uncultured bacterium]